MNKISKFYKKIYRFSKVLPNNMKLVPSMSYGRNTGVSYVIHI